MVAGERISPFLWPRLIKEENGRYKWGSIITYFLVMNLFSILYASAFYCFFQYVLYDQITVKVLKAGLNGNSSTHPFYSRPAYFYHFGMGCIMSVWYGSKGMSRKPAAV